jgi:hypothetical protein
MKKRRSIWEVFPTLRFFSLASALIAAASVSGFSWALIPKYLIPALCNLIPVS